MLWRLGGWLLAAGVAAWGQVRILGYWWENPLPYQSTPSGLSSLTAEQCGICHQEIYQEWRASVHAHALSDRQFQVEMAKSPETSWLCLNCHTPLENQLASIAVAVRDRSTHQPILKPNPRFDAALSREGVTCAVCHVQDGIVLGPYGDTKAPHPTRRDPRLLDERACGSCHQATAAYTDTLICTFDTVGEWRQSPYPARGQSCTYCHMPPVSRPVALGGPVRPSRRHLFLGSRIPKQAPLPAEHRAYYDLYSSGLSVRIEPGNPAGETLPVKLVLRNARSGHLLPTGDPERYILIHTELLDSAGTRLDRQSHRIGQEWVWNPKARKISDNRLKPLESRTLQLVLQTGGSRPPARIRVVAENWRMSPENAAYHKLTVAYPLSAIALRLERRLAQRQASPAPVDGQAQHLPYLPKQLP